MRDVSLINDGYDIGNEGVVVGVRRQVPAEQEKASFTKAFAGFSSNSRSYQVDSIRIGGSCEIK